MPKAKARKREPNGRLQRAKREGPQVNGEWHDLTADEAAGLIAGLCSKFCCVAAQNSTEKVVGEQYAKSA